MITYCIASLLWRSISLTLNISHLHAIWKKFKHKTCEIIQKKRIVQSNNFTGEIESQTIHLQIGNMGTFQGRTKVHLYHFILLSIWQICHGNLWSCVNFEVSWNQFSLQSETVIQMILKGRHPLISNQFVFCCFI